MHRLLNRFQWPTWLFAGLIVTAITGQNACAAVIQFSFTAADFYGSTGSGTFSYDADSYGYPVSATHKNYGSPVTIDFTSQLGTIHVSDLYGSVDVWNNDPSQQDKVSIVAYSRDSSPLRINSVILRNLASTAIANTSLPLSYSSAQFPDQRNMSYYDFGASRYRDFYIDAFQSGASGGPVPEIDPSSCGSAVALLLGAFGLCERRNRWRNRAGI